MLFQGLAIGIVYWFTLRFSGQIVGYFLRKIDPEKADDLPIASVIIGKCENIIAVSCIIVNELAGLSIIFAAKALVRNTSDSSQDDFYLCGTLVNLVWSLAMGAVARWIWCL